MSLLSVIQDGLYEIGEMEVPKTIVGNRNATALQSFAIAKRALREVSIAINNTEFLIQTSFTIVENAEVSGVAETSYALESDFVRIVNQTMRTDEEYIFGALTAEQWAAYQIDNTSTLSRSYRIFNSVPAGTILLGDTIPKAINILNMNIGEVVDYEYMSNALVKDVVDNRKLTYTADNDVALIDEQIVILGFKFRFLSAKGYDAAADIALADYRMAIDDYRKRDGAQIISVEAHNYYDDYPYRSNDYRRA